MRGYKPVTMAIITLLLISCPDGTGSRPQPAIILDFTAPASQTGQISIADDFAGICHSGYSGNLDREYDMLDEMGVVWLHRDFSWSAIQQRCGEKMVFITWEE